MCPSARCRKCVQHDNNGGTDRICLVEDQEELRLKNISKSLQRIHSLQENIRKELDSAKMAMSSKLRNNENVFRILSSDMKEISRMVELVRLINEKMDVQSPRMAKVVQKDD
eukprot:gene12206-13464_t